VKHSNFFFKVESLEAVSLHRGGVQLCKDCAACITFRNFLHKVAVQEVFVKFFERLEIIKS
jgi:hypothetical protein